MKKTKQSNKKIYSLSLYIDLENKKEVELLKKLAFIQEKTKASISLILRELLKDTFTDEKTEELVKRLKEKTKRRKQLKDYLKELLEKEKKEA